MAEWMREAVALGQQAGSRYRLSVPRDVPSGMAGTHLGRAAGASLEFKDHREYQPGDDLRFIDWSAYARSDRLTVKLYREETHPHMDLLIDASRSMALAETDKARATVALAGALCVAARNARFSQQVLIAADRCEPMEQGHLGPELWPELSFEGRSNPAMAIARTPPRLRPRGVRVLISDLLFMADPRAMLEVLAHGATSVHVIQLLAQEDADPPTRGNIRLVDCESGEARELFIDAAAQKRYRANLAGHQQLWHDAARQVGGTLSTLIAEPLLETWDFSELLRHGVVQVA